MLQDIIILAALLMGSSFFSGAEMAYVVASKIKIEIRARKNNPAARSALFFTRNPQTFSPLY